MKRLPPRVALALLALSLLLVGYVLVFSTYVSGLSGGRNFLPPAAWEKALRSALVAGPVVALFLLLVSLSWAWRWRSGILPFTAGAAAALVVARYDAGIARATDVLWVLPLLGVAFAADRRRRKEE